MKEMEENGIKVKVPKGTSDYQAAWIMDSDGEVSEDEDEEQVMDYSHTVANDEVMDDEDDSDNEAECDYMDNYTTKTGDFDELDPVKEQEDLEAYLERKKVASQEDLEFPDEVDTPLDMPARVRFQK
jgi:pre-rRNA-processing protein TSR1